MYGCCDMGCTTIRFFFIFARAIRRVTDNKTLVDICYFIFAFETRSVNFAAIITLHALFHSFSFFLPSRSVGISLYVYTLSIIKARFVHRCNRHPYTVWPHTHTTYFLQTRGYPNPYYGISCWVLAAHCEGNSGL